MNSYRLSIALVTRNRPISLERTLYSLSKQNVTPYEILISDDSNDKKFIDANKTLAQKFGCKYLTGPQKGLYTNRNFVALQCSGTHFRTMDDDHEFPDLHLAECLKAIESEPEVIWTIGEYFAHEKIRNVPCRIPGQLHPRGFSTAPKKMTDYYGISCGGTIYPAELLNKYILNCELYKFGILYLEYGSRLKKIGYKIKFLPTTYIVHHEEQTTASEMSRGEIAETKLFSMFCLSFKYQPGIYNFSNTVGQTALDFIRAKYSVRTIINAYKKYKEFTTSPDFPVFDLEHNK